MLKTSVNIEKHIFAEFVTFFDVYRTSEVLC